MLNIILIVAFVMLIKELEPGYNFLTSNPVLFQICQCSLRCHTYTTVVHKMILIVRHFKVFQVIWLIISEYYFLLMVVILKFLYKLNVFRF